MTQHDDGESLLHMLTHAEEAVDMARGRQREQLNTDRQLNLSPVRLLEIVGEAASRVSPTGRSRLPAISWPEIVGMRNRLAHAYDKVDFDVLWDVLRNDLPPLIAELRKALGEKDSVD